MTVRSRDERVNWIPIPSQVLDSHHDSVLEEYIS